MTSKDSGKQFKSSSKLTVLFLFVARLISFQSPSYYTTVKPGSYHTIHVAELHSERNSYTTFSVNCTKGTLCTMASAVRLSYNDNSVLSALFDAECKPAAELPLPAQQVYISSPLQQRETRIIAPISAGDVSASTIRTAIHQLSELIEENPSYASAYNNRAQATQILIDHHESGEIEDVFADINIAIKLASAPTTPTIVLGSAHTQRGAILFKASRSLAKNSEAVFVLPEEYAHMDSSGLESAALKDFQTGARYGNVIAKEMTVKFNPMAKLCGQIVREAMVRDMEENGVLAATR